MPTWTEIRQEIDRERNAGTTAAQDVVRRRKLAALEGVTQRPLVVYATDFTDARKARDSGGEVTMSTYDKDGWAEVTERLPDGPLDLMLHSPGGSPFMAEWLVSMLRSRFEPIRAIVPHSAKSAAAMVALAADELLMDERGELGPIDPQLVFPRDQEMVASPAQAILDQFERAQGDIAGNVQKLPAWIPILRQYGPSLLEEARNAIELAQALVTGWLKSYMYKGDADGEAKASAVASWIGNHNNFKAHPRQIGIDELKEKGVASRSSTCAGSRPCGRLSGPRGAPTASLLTLPAPTRSLRTAEAMRSSATLRRVSLRFPCRSRRTGRFPNRRKRSRIARSGAGNGLGVRARHPMPARPARSGCASTCFST